MRSELRRSSNAQKEQLLMKRAPRERSSPYTTQGSETYHFLICNAAGGANKGLLQKHRMHFEGNAESEYRV